MQLKENERSAYNQNGDCSDTGNPFSTSWSHSRGHTHTHNNNLALNDTKPAAQASIIPSTYYIKGNNNAKIKINYNGIFDCITQIHSSGAVYR